MKKVFTILMTAMILVCATIGFTVAEESTYDVEVGSTLEIVGIGTMDRELLAQSGWGYDGQKLTESMYTKWMGTDGLSNITYKSDLNVFLGKSDEHEDTNLTEIAYGQTAITSNMRQTVCSRNYEAGVASGFKLTGTSIRAFEIDMLPNSNYLDFEGAIEGSAVLRHVVVDPDTKLKIVKERTEVDGKFNIDWEAYGDKLIYPGDEGDWLGCP